MIARSFAPVAFVGFVGVAALACYIMSLQVASERAAIAQLKANIDSTRHDIRSLQTELGTRGRMRQLETWNAEVLALSAPTAGQFLDSPVNLARFDTTMPDPIATQPVRLASAPAQSPAEMPAVRLASAPAAQAKIVPLAATAPASNRVLTRTATPIAETTRPRTRPAAAAPLVAASAPSAVTRSRTAEALAPPASASARARTPAATTGPRARTTTTAAASPARSRIPTPVPTSSRTRSAAAPPATIASRARSTPTAAAARRPREAGLIDINTLRDLGARSRTEQAAD